LNRIGDLKLDAVKRVRKNTGIGELRNRILIQDLVLTSDGQGGFSEAWVDVATVWAKVNPIKKSERIYAGRIEYQRTHEVTIRNLSAITNTMSIIFNNATLQIKSTRSLQNQPFYMVIDCEENQGT